MKTVLKIYTRVVILMFPFFFLPIIYDEFGLGKIVFLVGSGLLGLVLWLIDLLVNKREIIKLNKFLGWFLLLVVWGAISFFRLNQGEEMRSLVSGTGFGFFLGLMMWSFLWVQITDREEYKKQLTWLSISGVIVGITSVLAFMIPNAKFPLLLPKNSPLISIDQGWSITGSILGEAILFLLLIWEWLKKLLKKLRGKASINEYFKEAMAVAFFGLLLFLDVYKTIKIGWIFLDNKSSWVIATEVLKNSPVFGVGLGNFTEAFLNFRPASFNLTKFWAMTFDKSGMGILQIWTEMGIGGLVLIFLAVKNWMGSQKGPAGAGFRSAQRYFWELGILGLLILFLPLNQTAIFLWVWLVANNFGESSDKKMVLRVGENGLNVMPYLVTLIFLAGVGLVGFNLAKITLADFYWRESLLAASKNDGVKTYELQIKAIGLNPTMADYRVVYSQTNFALANNLLNKKDLTDEEKQKGSTLIQQSVREAKAAITLNGKTPDYWTNLAAIYKSLIGMVDGSADWAVQSYQQAILLNPSSFSLYMDLGGLYYAGGDFESADRYFEKAVVNKNDFPNAWYNWAYSAKQNGKLQVAVERLSQALKLVPATSADYEKASGELVTWKQELDSAKQNLEKNNLEAETLKTPEALPTVKEEDKVAVPTGENGIEPPTQ